MSEILVAPGDAAATSPTYEELLTDIKSRVHLARTRAVHAANAELIGAYWYIGKEILRRQEEDGNRRGRGGPKIVQRLSTDLRAAFPDMSGFSVNNLRRMRKFAAAWPDEEMLPRGVGALPWGHISILLDRLNDRLTRDWYAGRAGQWTRTVLEHHIHTRLHEREGAVLSNFDETLPPPTSRASCTRSATASCTPAGSGRSTSARGGRCASTCSSTTTRRRAGS